jgi:hypothetical protein
MENVNACSAGVMEGGATRAPTQSSGTAAARASDAGVMTFADLLQGLLRPIAVEDASVSSGGLDEQPMDSVVPAGNDQAQSYSEKAPISVEGQQFRVDVIPLAFVAAIDVSALFQPFAGETAPNPAATSNGTGAWIADPGVLPGAGPPEGETFVVPVSQAVSATIVPVDALLLQQGQATDTATASVLPPPGYTPAGEAAMVSGGDGVYAQQSTNTALETLPLVLQEPVAGTTPAAVNIETNVSVLETALAGDGSFGREGEQLKVLSIAVDPPNMTLGGAPAQLALEGATQSTPTHTAEIGNNLLYDRIVEGVRVAGNAEATEVIVHLKPDSLGRLSIRVLADEHGMRVEIKAEHEAVRQVMQDNLADLQSRLAEKGFSGAQLAILADTGWQSRREPELPFAAASSEGATETENAPESVMEPVPLAASGIIDYLA